MTTPEPTLPQPQFGAHDYEIGSQAAGRQVTISALLALRPQVGDRYTIDRNNRICDLVVEEVSRGAGGRWNAQCRVSGPSGIDQ